MKVLVLSTMVLALGISCANAHFYEHINNHSTYHVVSDSYRNNPRRDRIMKENNFFVDDTNINVTTVAKALKMKDDDSVVLEGNIVRQIDDDEFIFKDKTGEIEIDVDDKIILRFSEARISPKNIVRIQGKLDKELMEKTKIDVYKLEIIK